MLLQNSFKNYFASLVDVNDSANRNMTGFARIMDPDISSQRRLDYLTNDEDIVFLGTNASREIQVFHSPKNLGGSVMRKFNKFVCLIGLGPNATCVEIDDANTAMTKIEVCTPTLDELENCPDAKAIEDLGDRAEAGTVTFKGTIFFIVAPWLRDLIMDSDSNDPFELIPMVFSAAKDFDREAEHAVPPYEEFERAATHGSDFALWAWSVGKGKIPSIHYTVRPDDEEMESYRKDRISKCISPSLAEERLRDTNGAISDEVMRNIAASLSNQNEEFALSRELREKEFAAKIEKEENKKNKVKDLHPAVLNMLLNAAATNSESRPEDLPESCKAFFNRKSAGQADEELKLQFENLDMGDVFISYSLVQALFGGKLTYPAMGSPCNLSAFSFCERDPSTDDDEDRRGLVIHLAKEEGKGRSLEEIKSSTRQVVRAPSDYNSLITQLEYFWGAYCIFFGPDSIATLAVKSIIEEVAEQKIKFKKASNRDKTFATRFLYAVDVRFQEFLHLCKLAKNRDDIDDRILDVSDLIKGVRFGSFSMDLPPNTRAIKADRNTREKDEIDPKRRKPNPKEDGKRHTTNDAQHPELKMRDSEDWKRDFVGKHAKLKPSWDAGKTKMCVRWHIKGDCFRDCEHSAIHVASDQIPSDKLAAMKKFLAKCRD